jgi:heterotetrameric sarcosine oxidase alpha subunit
MTIEPQPFRLAAGGLIARDNPRGFRFDGKQFVGYAGDTLASALLANGVSLFGRSFKYHRPRGLLSAGPEEPNALVELRDGARREPNSRAPSVELFEGLTARSQNRWPSLGFDVLAINSILSPVLAAGFYYKTFMWPTSFWEKLYEPLIRRAAGLGRAPDGADPDRYEQANLFCDVLVIGAGPAGLLAALAAARSGARVVLCEEDFSLGGRLLSESQTIDDKPPVAWLRSIEAELMSCDDIQIMRRTTVFGVYDHATYAAVERVNDHVMKPPPHEPRQRLWRIIAKRSILATGAIERPLVFGDNDRPGIMLAGAVRSYVNRFAVKAGTRAVVFANNDYAGRTITDMRHAGISVAAFIDARPEKTASVEASCAAAGVEWISGSVTRARGVQRVKAAEVMAGDGSKRSIACDLIAISGGWNPTIHLASHLGEGPRWDDAIAAFVPARLPPGMSAAGAAAGQLTLVESLRAGAQAGAAAATECGFSGEPVAVPNVADESAAITPLWRVRNASGKAFIDFQNDVCDTDVEVAEREGFRAVEHLKRYTTLGMATDQGKTANVNGLAIMAELTQRSISDIGTTRFRPPYSPVTIGAIAGGDVGKRLKPARLAPSHFWAQEQGATFIETGLWLRAQYFPRSGDVDWLTACNREVLTTRNHVGVCDVSTLGKIDIQGPDAGVFLDRLYCNTFSTLPIGRSRYGLMLREDGFVFDDGTTSRLAQDRYFMTTTTANAAAVMQHMDFCHQVLWPKLDVQFVSVSEQWAQYSVAGPKARTVIRALVDAPFDISNTAFPFMAAADVRLCGGVPGRLYRISFSGELAYEIAAPSRFGDALIRAIMSAGAEHQIAAYGLEALAVMRIEKGHVGGAELNGQTTVRDLGLGRMMATKKDYIGRVMAQRIGLTAVDRPALVGLKPVDRSATIGSGAHFLPLGAAPVATNDQGHMTSAGYSPMLGHWVGLGLLARGPQRMGETVRAYDPLRGRDTEVEVCSPVFFDPEGSRLRD